MSNSTYLLNHRSIPFPTFYFLSLHSLSTFLFLFSVQFYVPFQPQSIPFPPLYFFSVSNSTFSTIPPFTLHLSLSFQFPILISQPHLHSLSIFLFLFSFQDNLRNHPSIHSPPFSFFQFLILPSPPSLRSLSTSFSSFILLLLLSQCPLLPVSTFPFFNFFSPPLPFALSLCSLQSPFTSLQNLSWEVRHCPKRTCVHILYL